MENERYEHSLQLKQAEKEIFDVNQTLATVTINFESMQKDLIAVQNENKVVARQVTVLMQEKAQLAVEMQDKLELEKKRADCDQRAQLSQIEELTEKVRNQDFLLEASRTRSKDFEERYTQYRKEIMRVKEEAKDAQERQRQTEVLKENL